MTILLSHTVVNLFALSTPALIFSSERFANDLASRSYADLLIGLSLGVVTNGRLGLFLLFVLSGYALSVSHFNLQKNTLASAAASRYFRLLIPILYTSLLAFALSKSGLFFNIRATEGSNLEPTDWLRFTYGYSANLKDFVTFVFYDVFFKYDWFKSYNVALWTIHFQLTGSFIVYGFLAIFRRTQATQWAIAILIAVALLASTPVLACFMFGYLIAEFNTEFPHPSKRDAFEFPLVAVFFSVCVLSTGSHFQGDRALCLLASGIVATVSLSKTLRGLFSTRLSRFLGRISFPIYLIQIPVICSWSSYWFMKLPSLGFSNAAAIALNLSTTIMICLALSVALLPLDKFSISASKTLGRLLLRPAGTTTAFQASKSLQRHNS